LIRGKKVRGAVEKANCRLEMNLGAEITALEDLGLVNPFNYKASLRLAKSRTKQFTLVMTP
jgi:hypothetical protein